jgi:hypothetical protein
MSALTSLADTIINLGIVPIFLCNEVRYFFDDFRNWLSYDLMITPVAKNITDRITISGAA